MNKALSKLVILVLTIILFEGVFEITSYADIYENATLTVILSSSDKQITANNTKVNLYKIGNFSDIEQHKINIDRKYKGIEKNLNLKNTEDTCTYSNTIKLINWIKNKNIQPDYSSVSDRNGKVIFNKDIDFTSGIYLIDIPDCNAFEVSSFIAETPMYEAGKLYFNVSASPKLEKPNDHIDTSSSSINDTNKVVDNKKNNENNKEKIKQQDDKTPNTGDMIIRSIVLLMAILTIFTLGYVLACFSTKSKKK